MVTKLIRKRGDLVKKILSILILMALLVLPAAAGASLAPTLTFQIPANGGLVAFSGTLGGTGTITGTGMVVTSVIGIDTPLHPGQELTLPAGEYLVFTTGTVQNFGLWVASQWIESYQTDPSLIGGSVVINPGSPPDILSGNLIQGTMSSAQLFVGTASGSFTAGFNSMGVAAYLASYYGVTGLGTGVISLGTGGTGAGSTWSSVTPTSFMPANGTITLYTSVPIPPTVLLLGAGLMGIGVVRKRII